jgi:peptidyl-prolyl cis-trans isomerase C
MPLGRLGLLAFAAALNLVLPSNGQQPQSIAADKATPAPGKVAATVNGQVIPEAAVLRGLKRIPPDKQADVRAEILNFLIENMLLDQYLTQIMIQADEKEVDAKMKQIFAEIQKQGSTLEKMMQELMLSEEGLRNEIRGQLRWEKFASGQATDKALRELFDNNKEMFDGSMVRARHILLMAPADDAAAAAAAKNRLLAFKKQLEEQTAQAVAKLPAQTDAADRAKARDKLLEENFAKLATKESACPSRTQGGDMGWFPRALSVVEPFAKVAFALKPYEISDVVTTQFGFHLILVTDRKPGKVVKFEEVKDDVREVFNERLREGLCAQLKPKAQIVVNPPQGANK